MSVILWVRGKDSQKSAVQELCSRFGSELTFKIDF